MGDLFDIANLITTVGVDAVKIKPEPGLPEKSSNEILTELFSTFDADEGIVSPQDSDTQQEEHTNVKLEKSDKLKKKKSKKKHKHKDKKHKRKVKRNSSNSNSDAENNGTKKKKKHKRKYKHKHESASSKSSGSDEPKSKVRKLDVDSFSDSAIKEDHHNDGFDILGRNDTVGKIAKLEEQLVVKKEPGCVIESAVQSDDRVDSSSPRLPPITKKMEDDPEESMIPKLLDKTKQCTQGKILIKDLKNSIVYNEAVKEVECKEREKAARMEDGELSESSIDNRTPTLSPTPPRHDDLSSPTLCSGLDRLKKRTPSPIIRTPLATRDDLRLILKEKEKKRLVEIGKSRSKSEKDRKGIKERSRKESKDKECKYSCSNRSRERKRSDSQTHSNSHRSRSGGREKRSRERRERNRSNDRWERERSRERRKHPRDDKDRHRSRSEDKSRDRYIKGRSRSRERKERIEIDKKKLLEIARRNAINMIKQGTLPLAQQDKAIAAIQAGGKTVDELTDFCKSLSKSEALGELSSISSDEDGSGSEKGFHHPFLVKERPSSIIMNIRDAKQLPTKTFQEKTAESSNQLRLQFPVSSGQHHRKTENEWVPVAPKKQEPKKAFVPASTPAESLALIPASNFSLQSAPPSQSAVFSQGTNSTENVDIGSIVSQRLAAMRKLRENPNDVQALSEMYRAQNEMKSWAESKQMPGQFTGSTGAKVLSAAELAAGYQAWARKDQLVSAQPVSGGMGMALLQKMGWRPGEGLGKNKEGTLEPLQLEVKLDKRGLVSDQDIGKKVGRAARPVVPTIKTLEGKHPVSLLGEYCSKRKYGAPVYELCFECGPDHKKNFLFKVKVNDIEYKPSVASPNKKQAKAEAAQICLQSLGLLPS